LQRLHYLPQILTTVETTPKKSFKAGGTQLINQFLSESRSVRVHGQSASQRQLCCRRTLDRARDSVHGVIDGVD
jgi:hypothetical protein